METIDYLKLAEKQFLTLKKKTLDEDRDILGAENEENYEVNGLKFKIKVDGFWEKATWFNWEVTDEQGEKIAFGTEY